MIHPQKPNYLSNDLPVLLKESFYLYSRAYLMYLDSFETDQKELIELCQNYQRICLVLIDSILDCMHMRGYSYRTNLDHLKDDEQFMKCYNKCKNDYEIIVQKWKELNSLNKENLNEQTKKETSTSK